MAPHIYRSPYGDNINIPQGNAVEALLASPALNDPALAKRKLFTSSVDGSSLTIQEYLRSIPRSSAVFRNEYGVQFGDVVALSAPNSILTSTIHLAVMGLGAVISPANVQYNAEELAHQVRMTKPRVLIVFDPLESIGVDAVKLAGLTDSVRVVKFSELAAKLFGVIRAPAAEEVKPVPVDGKSQWAVCCFSSGTSGLPKGVMTSHRNIIANVIQCASTDGPAVRTDVIVGAVLPMSHIFGLLSFLWLDVYMARRMIVFPKFDLEDLVVKTVQYEISMLVLVPPIILVLAKHPLLDQHPKFKEVLKYVLSGAAPLSESTAALFQERIPGSDIAQGYGLTETSPVVFTGGSEAFNYDKGTVGHLVSGTEVRLVSPETGEDVAPGERGELWIRGPQVMMGYLNDPESTAKTITPDGWLKTGDVAVAADNHQFMIVDRIKELIKSKGHQVAPAELEGILLTSPHVADAAVIGVDDEHRTTELPRAFVVLRDPSKLEEVISWFNRRVAIHKRLWGGAVLVPEIPKSPSGKILRRFLRDRKGDVAVGITLAKL